MAGEVLCINIIAKFELIPTEIKVSERFHLGVKYLYLTVSNRYSQVSEIEQVLATSFVKN